MISIPLAHVETPNLRLKLRQWYRSLHRVPTAWFLLAMLILPTAIFFASRGVTAQQVLLGVLLIASTITDLMWKRIFNWITFPLLLWVIVLQLVAPNASWLGLPAPEDSLLGGAVCFGAMLALYLQFRGGEGDVKLLAAIGAIVGPWHGIEALTFGYMLAAGVGAVVVLVRLGMGKPSLKGTLPMAPFFAVGTVLTLILK